MTLNIIVTGVFCSKSHHDAVKPEIPKQFLKPRSRVMYRRQPIGQLQQNVFIWN